MALDPTQLVLYLEEWKVLICLNEHCRHALTSDGVALHFRTFHKDVYGLSIRKQIVDYSNSLVLIRPFEVHIPVNGPLPIEGLRIHHGWKCTRCYDVGPVFDARREHSKREHNWNSLEGIVHIHI